MSKPRVMCARIGVCHYSNGQYIAYLTRLSDHPKLGPPRCESQTRTSLILRVDFEKKELETLNTVYYWED